jgi:hypothetical protein
MNKQEAESQYKALTELLAQKLARLDEARREQVKTKVAFEREQETYGRLIRDLKMVYAEDPAIKNQPDPSTGKVNKEWTTWLIEKAVEKDAEFVQGTGVFYAIQEAYFAAEVALHQAGEDVAATKADMLLFGALLKYVGSPE